jgi:hypothetical protein
MKPHKKKKAKGRAKPPHPLTMEETKRIERLLSEPQNLTPSRIQKELTSPPMALAFVEKLTFDLPQVVVLVSTVRESFPQKEVQRAIKKTVFRLKQKGVILPESDKAEKKPVFIKAPEREEPTSFVGPIDGMGNRPLMLVIPQIPSGVDLAMAFTNDETGLVEFLFGRYSKRAMREVKDLFFQREPNMVETSISHGATLLEEAYRLNPSSSEDPSKQYLKLRPWILDHVGLLEKPAIYGVISPKDVTTKSVTFHDVEKFLAQPLMESWILEVETMRPVLEDIQDTDESRILISEEQKMDRIRDIKEKAVADLFPMDKRLIVKRRLEEMAYLFEKRSEGDIARLALQIGHSLEAETDSFLVNPFLLALIERSVDFFEAIKHSQEGEPLEEDPRPTIIRP